jgi:hypothetical protein
MCNKVCRYKHNEQLYRIAWVNFDLSMDFSNKLSEIYLPQ